MFKYMLPNKHKIYLKKYKLYQMAILRKKETPRN